MIQPIYLALLFLAMIYVPIWLYTKLSPKAKEHGLVAWGPVVMVKTKIGIETMGKLSRHRKFWRACGVFSRIVTLLLMGYIVIILVIDLILLPVAMSQGGIGIEYALAIPGINPMLPLVYGWIGLVIAMCVHELAHGIQTKANDMEVVSSGVLYGVVPLGAFVEPEEQQLKKCNRRAKMDVYAAGITTNFIVAVICFSLMAGMMGGCLEVEHGDNAAVMGTSFGGGEHIPNYGIVISIEDENGETPDNMTRDEFMRYLEDNGCGMYSVTYLFKGETNTIQSWMGVYVNQVVNNSPAGNAGIKAGDYLKSIKLHSEGDYTEIGTISQWSKIMDRYNNGDKVDIEIVHDGAVTSLTEITLSKKEGTDNKGYLGVATTDSGYNFVTPNMVRDSALNPFYGQNDFVGYAMSIFTFIGKPFQGFSPVPPETQWWFHNTSFLPDNVFWIVMSIVFWTFWLNIVLGVTNALPAVPFDGGYLYAGGIDWIYEKSGITNEEERAKKVNQVVGFTSSFAIVLLIMIMVAIII